MEIKNKFKSLLKIKIEKYKQRKELGNINKVIIFGLTLSFIKITEMHGANMEEKYFDQNS